MSGTPTFILILLAVTACGSGTANTESVPASSSGVDGAAGANSGAPGAKPSGGQTTGVAPSGGPSTSLTPGASGPGPVGPATAGMPTTGGDIGATGGTGSTGAVGGTGGGGFAGGVTEAGSAGDIQSDAGGGGAGGNTDGGANGGGALGNDTDAGGQTALPGDMPVMGDLPLVYEEEFTGEDCPTPPLPGFAELESIAHLPDPFLMASGERMTRRAQWRCRRAELKAILEKYDVGAKPGKPSTVDASLDGNQITINVAEGGSSFTMTATIARPANAAIGPIPAIIGINSPTGSLPANVFSSRGIATITYNANELASTSFNGPARNSGNFYNLYPTTDAGFMIRWAWGVSRLIDALEELPEANIDLKHLAVSGCSYQGKIALYAGAFDERIALTIPHESGGGGTISWRYSQMLEKRDNTEVENLLHAQGAPWYAQALMQFNNDPNKLPFDHHELIAMVAPRAFLAIESTAIARMGAEAARVDALAAREVWTALGVPDRMGASEENVNHCVWHDGFTPDLEAYVDKYLLEKDTNTDILRSVFTIDTDTWIPWETPELD